MSPGLVKGGTVLDAPEHIPAIWGQGAQVLWAQGEPFIIAGPPGVGKTTLIQQVTLARCGITPSNLEVLGLMVTPGEGRTLLVAADRPRQALRSMRRMVRPDQRQELDDRLLIWQGPFDLMSSPDKVVEMLRAEGADTIILDSIKDIAGDVTDGKVGATFNRALQVLIAAGIEVGALHHSRKAQDGNRTPRKLDDLHGSTWIAAGAGSVVFLIGEAGDATVELRHLKQPSADVGPLTIVHDHEAGLSRILEGTTAEDIVKAAGASGVTVKATAVQLFVTERPNRNQVEKARRKLDAIERMSKVEKNDVDGVAVYRSVTPVTPNVTPSRSDHGASRNGSNNGHAPVTALHAQGSTSPPSPVGGRRDPECELFDQVREAFDAEEIA